MAGKNEDPLHPPGDGQLLAPRRSPDHDLDPFLACPVDLLLHFLQVVETILRDLHSEDIDQFVELVDLAVGGHEVRDPLSEGLGPPEGLQQVEVAELGGDYGDLDRLFDGFRRPPPAHDHFIPVFPHFLLDQLRRVFEHGFDDLHFQGLFPCDLPDQLGELGIRRCNQDFWHDVPRPAVFHSSRHDKPNTGKTRLNNINLVFRNVNAKCRGVGDNGKNIYNNHLFLYG